MFGFGSLVAMILAVMAYSQHDGPGTTLCLGVAIVSALWEINETLKTKK